MLKALITTSWITQDPPLLSSDKKKNQNPAAGTSHFQEYGWVNFSIPGLVNSDKRSVFSSWFQETKYPFIELNCFTKMVHFKAKPAQAASRLWSSMTKHTAHPLQNERDEKQLGGPEAVLLFSSLYLINNSVLFKGLSFRGRVWLSLNPISWTHWHANGWGALA